MLDLEIPRLQDEISRDEAELASMTNPVAAAGMRKAIDEAKARLQVKLAQRGR
jgi:hypothetical protein